MATTTDDQQSFLPMSMSYPLRIRVRLQGYVFSRRDALAFGTSDEQLRAWHAAGDVRRAGYGVYYISCGDDDDSAAAAETGRRRLRAMLLALGDGYFATHHSALLAWSLPVYPRGDFLQIHVGRLGERHWSHRPGIHLHRLSARSTVVTRDGISTVSAADAIAQVGASAGIEAAVVAADAGLHDGVVSVSEIATSVDALRGTPGCTRLRTLLELVDARSESPGESRLRLICAAAGVRVTPQVVIRDDVGHFVARVDLLVDDTAVILEFDGLLKYRGDANHEALVHEIRRETELRRLGYQVVRFTWGDLEDPQRVLALLRAATHPGAA